MSYFSTRCKTCTSKYKKEIHELVLEKGWSVERVEEWLKDKDPISDTALGDHFRKHVYPYQKFMKEADKYTKEYFQKRLNEDVSILERIRTHLEVLETTLGTVLENKQNFFKPSMIRELRGLVTDIVKCMGEYEKIKKEYYPEPEIDKEDIFKDFIEACEDIPVEYINKIAEKLKNKGY